MRFYRKGAYGRLFLLMLGLAPAPGISQNMNEGMAGNVASTCPANHYDEAAIIKSVHDGDTVKLVDGRKIRLIGINTPELARSGKPEQAFASDARDQLKQLIAASDNRVKLVYGKERLDRYQRTLAHLFLPNDQNLQLALLQRGLATASAYPPNVAFSDCYQLAEQIARCKSLGIWSDDDYATKRSATLDADTQGFHIISGQVERVSESGKGIWLFLQGGLMIGIRTEDLPNFDKNSLKSLTNKNVTVRGWLHPKKKAKKGVKFYMRLRHPSAIENASTPEKVSKC